MTKRRRLRLSQPIPDEVDNVVDQPTIPLNIAPIQDWRTDSGVRAAKVRISWGKVLATQKRAVDALGLPLRFIPASVAEIVRVWCQLGGAPHHLTRAPLLLARISSSGLAPLILLSVVALAEMEEHTEIADRLRCAIECAVGWLQEWDQRGTTPHNVLLLLDSGTPYPIGVPLSDPLQYTPPPFHRVPPEPGRDHHERDGRSDQPQEGRRQQGS